MLKSKVTFVLAPHPDDAELGCGGTIAKLVESGTDVYVIVFAKAPERKQELFKSAKMLEVAGCRSLEVPIRRFSEYRQQILDKLLKFKDDLNPDLVLQPSLTDIHQDHQVVAMEGLRAFKNINLLGYETSWNNLNFDAQLFVKLEERHLLKKARAVGCYRSQSDKRYIDPDYVKSVAKVRGVQIGCDYAEMFSFIRGVVE